MKNWKKLLTKEELRHLDEDAGVKNETGLKRTLAYHAEVRAQGVEPCYTCKAIGQKLALLDGCYVMRVDTEAETGLKYSYGVYYFLPRDLLSDLEIERWEEYEEHCLSSAMGLDRKGSIDHVQAWALEQGIKISKKVIGEAFSWNHV